MIGRLWNYFKRDLPRRGAALLFAIMIYWSISAQISEERPFTVPIEYRLDSGLILNSASGSGNAVITVRGARRDLNDLSPSAITARVRVDNTNRLPDGSYRVRIQPSDFQLPRGGLRVIRLEMPYDGMLTPQLTRRISRMVKVKARFAGKLAPEYRLSEWRVLPDEVRVSGPENVVGDIREVLTEPIPLSAAVEESFEYEAQLSIPLQTELQPLRVTVQADVIRNVEQRTFKQLPVAVMNDPNGSFTALPVSATPRVDVTLTGSAAALNALSPEDVRPFVNVGAIGETGVHTVPVELYVKGNATCVKTVAPGEIKIKVTRMSSK